MAVSLIALLASCRAAGPTPATVARGGARYIDGSSQFAGFDYANPDGRGAMNGRTSTRSSTDTNGTAFLASNATAVRAGGGWVEVSGRCGNATGAAPGWWVGVFPASAAAPIKGVNIARLPGNNTKSPFTPPFTLPAPLKFTAVYCGPASRPGFSRAWWVPDVRQPVVFVLVRGGEYGGAVEAARTAPVVAGAATAARPMQLRLARTATVAEMRVTWTSQTAASPEVRWGGDPTRLIHRLPATSTTYTPKDMCGEPARTQGWWDPHFFHSAVLDLGPVALAAAGVGRPSATPIVVYYQAWSAGLGSATRSFRVPSVGANETLRVVLTADVGATTPDKVSQHWAEGHAYQTVAGMAAWAEARAADLAFIVGDLSYATGYLGKWETFMNSIEPVSATTPLMVAQGNHEQDWSGTGTVGANTGALLGRDSGGECGVPTAARFPMAGSSTTVAAAPYWYSFEAGPVHFAMVNTELALGSGPQLAWLDADLAAVDRRATPWVVVMGHRPLQSGLGNSTVINRLFDRHDVDLTVAGHVHFARQSCPLRNGRCVGAPNVTGGYDGVVHVIAGNGGQALNNASAPSMTYPYTGSGCNWTAPAANCTAAKKITGPTQGSGTEFGWSYFEANATALRWSFIGSNDSLAHHTFAIARAYPRPRAN